MSDQAPEYVVDFPTLGYLQADWMAWHCTIPSGVHAGAPFVMYDYQLWCTANHGRIKTEAKYRPEQPILNQAFENRRSLIVGPQKIGKSPWAAATALTMALGPELFCGWAEGGEAFDCRDYRCGCGFVYEYEPGEPMGRPWPTPLVQLMATAEDQVDNTWQPMLSMIRNGPLSERVRAGESLVRIGVEGSINKVTSSMTARVGQPTTGFVQDETGLYTKSNGLVKIARDMRRGCSAFGGRGVELTNAWDPSEMSTAQQTYESRATDVFRYFRQPPANLSYKNKKERRRIHAFVYAGATHVDLNGIEAEAYELMELDPAEAARFYGNKLERGLGAWLPEGLWEDAYATAVLVAKSA